MEESVLFTRFFLMPYFPLTGPWTNSPSIWNCAYSLCCIRTIVVECTCRSNTFYPIAEVVINEVVCIAQFYGIEARAPIEHVGVAEVSKCRCRKFWSGCQGRATLEHAVVALVSQCRCLQCWSLSQGCATFEHAAVATLSKCSCWKFWCLCQG